MAPGKLRLGKAPSLPERIMSLPKELCLHILELALVEDKPIIPVDSRFIPISARRINPLNPRCFGTCLIWPLDSLGPRMCTGTSYYRPGAGFKRNLPAIVENGRRERHLSGIKVSAEREAVLDMFQHEARLTYFGMNVFEVPPEHISSFFEACLSWEAERLVRSLSVRIPMYIIVDYASENGHFFYDKGPQPLTDLAHLFLFRGLEKVDLIVVDYDRESTLTMDDFERGKDTPGSFLSMVRLAGMDLRRRLLPGLRVLRRINRIDVGRKVAVKDWTEVMFGNRRGLAVDRKVAD